MKVLHFITRFNSGGTSSYLYNLLQPHDSDLSQVIAFGRTNSPEFEDSRIENLPHYRLTHLQKNLNPILAFKAFLEIRTFISVEKPEVVNTHTSHAGFLVRIAVKSLKRRERPVVVHTIHGHLLYGYFSTWKTTLYVLVEKMLSQITDAYIVPGLKMSRELNHCGIISRGKPVAILNPPIPTQNTAQSLASTSIGNKTLRVGWMGRIAKIKRVDRIFQLASATPGIDFYLAGSKQGGFLGEKPDNLFILDWSSPSEFWPKMDLAILTSDNEAQPFVLLEAASFGIPAITTGVGSTEDAVVDGQTGFVLPWNLIGFQKIIMNLDANRLQLRHMGEVASKRIEREYSPQQVVEDLHKFYCKLTGQ